jgi:hypothetical protein
MRQALSGLRRFIVTPRVATHRLFVWLDLKYMPDSRLTVIARDDDVTFGILHSIIHEVWSLRQGGMHGVGNDPQYTPSAGFHTFPFPQGLSPNLPPKQFELDSRAVRISLAAKALNEQRDNWLNPPDLVRREPEIVKGFPVRIRPRSEAAEKLLKQRTLTNLYNERPAWLAHAHVELDRAVAAAYGWPENLLDFAQPGAGDDAKRNAANEEILFRLLVLNKEYRPDQKVAKVDAWIERSRDYLLRNLGENSKWAAINTAIWNTIQKRDEHILSLSDVDEIAATLSIASNDVLAVLALLCRPAFPALKIRYLEHAEHQAREVRREELANQLKAWWKRKEMSDGEWLAWAGKVSVCWVPLFEFGDE